MGNLFSMFRRESAGNLQQTQGTADTPFPTDQDNGSLEQIGRIKSLAKARLQQAEAFAQHPIASNLGDVQA